MKKGKRLLRKIYVFGNPLLEEDSLALKIAKKLEKGFPSLSFIHHDPNEEIKEKDLVVLDVALGIKQVTLITNLDQFETEQKVSLHDYDVAFSLKLMKKIGLIKTVKIIAIPMNYSEKKAYEEVKEQIETILK